MSILDEKEKIDLTCLIPCLNEEGTIGLCVTECINLFSKYNIKGEVLVADNNSDDKSREIAESKGARVIIVNERGYGNVLKEGIKNANGKKIFMADADMSYDFNEMKTFLDRMLKSGADFVLGCRLPKGGGIIEDGAMPFLNKYIGNPFLSWFARTMFKSNIIDFHCGARLFDKEKIAKLSLESGGMEYASEMIIRSILSGLKIEQVSVVLRKDMRKKQHSKLRPFRDGLRHLSLIIRIFINKNDK